MNVSARECRKNNPAGDGTPAGKKSVKDYQSDRTITPWSLMYFLISAIVHSP